METSSSDDVHSSLFNLPIVVAIISFLIAQSLRILLTWLKDRRWDTKKVLSSAGMPSPHAATVMGLAAAIGLKEGSESSAFAIAVVFACVVMYDATGVRLQAGRQAEVLNQIVFELPSEHPLSETRPLQEPLGHTPPQVGAGAFLGCMVALLVHVASSPGVS